MTTLKKVILTFCKWGGSSSGVRSLNESPVFSAFKSANPQIEVTIQPRDGKHPCAKAIWQNGQEKVVCVKNTTPEQIIHQLTKFRNESGRKAMYVTNRVLTKTATIQGHWNPFLNLGNKPIAEFKLPPPQTDSSIPAKKIIETPATSKRQVTAAPYTKNKAYKKATSPLESSTIFAPSKSANSPKTTSSTTPNPTTTTSEKK